MNQVYCLCCGENSISSVQLFEDGASPEVEEEWTCPKCGEAFVIRIVYGQMDKPQEGPE